MTKLTLNGWIKRLHWNALTMTLEDISTTDTIIGLDDNELRNEYLYWSAIS